MPTVKLSTKRQATFPQAVCESLGIGPGDQVDLESRVIDGETVWILRPHRVDWSWIGSVKPRLDASHVIEAVRTSAARGWGRDAGSR